MILDLHGQGLTVAEIARQTGHDRKTVRRYIARGLAAPSYGPRAPRPTRLAAFEDYLRERIARYPGLTGRRLLRELRERGYDGGYTAVTDFLRQVRPVAATPFEVRFETASGHQAQVDFAQFKVVFEDEQSAVRIVWLFSMVLGYSRWLWARFVPHQDLQTVLRCPMAAFAAMNGVLAGILYDRMKDRRLRGVENRAGAQHLSMVAARRGSSLGPAFSPIPGAGLSFGFCSVQIGLALLCGRCLQHDMPFDGGALPILQHCLARLAQMQPLPNPSTSP